MSPLYNFQATSFPGNEVDFQEAEKCFSEQTGIDIWVIYFDGVNLPVPLMFRGLNASIV